MGKSMRRRGLLTAIGSITALVALWPRTSPDVPPPRITLEALHLRREVPNERPFSVSFHLRNHSGRPATVQTRGQGRIVRAELLGMDGCPIRGALMAGCEGSQNFDGPDVDDFETLAPGGWTRGLMTLDPGVRAPTIPGRYPLVFSYVRAPYAGPDLWDRLFGELPTREARKLCGKAFYGELAGEIEIAVY